MKEESGSHFSLPMQLKKRRINSIAMKFDTKSPEDKYLFNLNKVRDIPIPYWQQIMRFPSAIDMHMAVCNVNVTCLCMQRHKKTSTLFTVSCVFAELRTIRKTLLEIIVLTLNMAK